MSANSKQVGGDHYKLGGEEHWDRVWRLYGRGYFVGCITKYVERYHLKNGVQDLEKAKHFLEKLIELESPRAEAVQPQPAQLPPVPYDFRGYFTEEGFRTNGETLYTCLDCGHQFWGTQQQALEHLGTHKTI